MGWGRTLLLGDIGTQLNVDEVQADVESVKRLLESQQSVDASQDDQLRSLQQENHELKIYVATLVRLLVSKNVLDADDVNKFVNLLDPA